MPEPGPDDMVQGVSLIQVAAVHAGVAEGFAEGDVLEVEQLPKDVWFEAELAWKARFSAEEPTLARYTEELERQQDRLGRPIRPIQDDLAPWVTFLRCYADDPAPFEALELLGMTLNDMARLGRVWNRRFEEETKVAEQAKKLNAALDKRVKDGDKPKMPAIEVGKAELTPSQDAGRYAAGKAEPVAAREAGASPTPLLGLDQYAALSAELRAAPENEHEAVLARFGIRAKDAIAIDAAWRARLESDRELRADFRVLSGHFEQQAILRRRSASSWPQKRVEAASVTGPPPALPIAAPPPESPRRPTLRTAPMHVMASMAVLPFRGGRAVLPPIAAALPPAPRRSGSIDVTGDVIPALRDSEVTPFDAPPPSIGSLSITPDISIVPDALVLPFIRGDGRPAVASIPIASNVVISLSEDMRARDDGGVDRTGDVIPALRDALPTPFELPRRPAPSDLDGTAIMTSLDLGDDEAEGPQPALTPELTLDQLASFHAEMSLEPRNSEAIRRRYQLASLEMQREVEQAWSARFAADHELRAAYGRKLAEFRAWLSRAR